VIKPGYNFVTIRPIDRARKLEIPQEYFLDWAQYLAEHKVYFVFLYTVQHALPERESIFEPETVAKMKEIAGEYFLGDLIGVGALWNTKNYANRSWNSISGAVTLRPTSWLTASATYSYVNSLGVLGIATNVHTSFCNLFCGVDYIATKYGTASGGAIPVPLNQNSVNLAFGLSIPLGARMF
jgi:hypothetical protein